MPDAGLVAADALDDLVCGAGLGLGDELGVGDERAGHAHEVSHAVADEPVGGAEVDDQYAYAREDYDWWQARLSRRLANGLFGENLTTEGVDVNGAVIGERWRIGPRLVLQPTFGRIPCVTFQRKMGEPRWVKTFARANRPGRVPARAGAGRGVGRRSGDRGGPPGGPA